VEQLLIIYEDTVATCSASRAGLLSHAKPIQARLSGDSTQMPTSVDSRFPPLPLPLAHLHVFALG